MSVADGVGTLREAKASLTRRQVVEAASTLFLAQGYVGTSIGAIARLAGVSVQTIYNAVGNKSALLSAMLDVAASGPDSPTPIPHFMADRTRRASTAVGVIDVLADWFVEVHGRTADVWSVIHQAAAVDEEAASVEKRRGEQRLRNYGLAAVELRARGALDGLTDEEAAATIWAIGHPDVFQTLVRDIGWTPAAYREWVRTSLTGALRVG
jgi:AcrR family transcriptional regulator